MRLRCLRGLYVLDLQVTFLCAFITGLGQEGARNPVRTVSWTCHL